jgi:serine/threonine protein kinase
VSDLQGATRGAFAVTNKTLREDRYVIIRPLGEGSQGETFEAFDRRDGRAVAVKRFDVRGAKKWKDVELAEREARVLATLKHPKLPGYVEHFEEDGALYLVMDLVAGETLAARMKRGEGLDAMEAQRLLADAADALKYLHGRSPPIIHRDIKPSNVICTPEGGYAFVDFGAVRDRMKREGGSTVVGTFGYMAPEQFQGRAAPGSDVYAVAATTLAAITCEEPETLPHKGLAIDVAAALGKNANASIASALIKMLSPDPDHRVSEVIVPVDDSRSQSPKRTRDAKRGEEDWRDHRDGWRREKDAAKAWARRAKREWKGEAKRAANAWRESVRDDRSARVRSEREPRDMQRRSPPMLTLLWVLYGVGCWVLLHQLHGIMYSAFVVAGAVGLAALSRAVRRPALRATDDVRIRVDADANAEATHTKPRVVDTEFVDDEEEESERKRTRDLRR